MEQFVTEKRNQSNPFIESLYQTLTQRYSVDSVNMTMGEWICKNTRRGGMPFSFDRYPFQKQIADDMHHDLVCIKCSQIGLALDLETPIPTPSGWTTMGEIREGDRVYNEKGQSVKVTYVSPTYTDRKCYEVLFCDGTSIVCDEHHKWYVEAKRSFHPESEKAHRGRPQTPSGFIKSGVFDTKTILRHYKKHGLNFFAIPTTEPLQSQKEELPLDPYYLGLWLGDGHSYSTRLSSSFSDRDWIVHELKSRGFVCVDVTKKAKCSEISVDFPASVRFKKVYTVLEKLNLLKNKHVPGIYLRTSVEQRLELLQGLMDTDGSITKKGRCSFHNTNPELIRAVMELSRSLGLKPRVRWRDTKGKTATMKCGHVIHSRLPIGEVSFVSYSDFPVFKMPRKRDRLLCREKGRSSESFRRRIVSIKEVPTRPVKCISVDSERHLYLAGDGMVPTHNTEIQLRKAVGFVTRNSNVNIGYTLPDKDLLNVASKTRMNEILDSNKIFESPRGSSWIRSAEIKQINNSYIYMLLASEAKAFSIPLDFIILDERDMTDDGVATLFNSRLQGSDIAIRQEFSTPSYPDFGVDNSYRLSDQRVYYCKCHACQRWQEPVFNDRFVRIPGLKDVSVRDINESMLPSLSLDEAQVICEYCHAPLDLKTSSRKWIAMYPQRGKDKRGYRVSPFSTGRLSIKYIVKERVAYEKRQFLRGWYNTVLGEAYVDETIQISEQAVRQAFRSAESEGLDGKADVFVGIDMGKICHVVIGFIDHQENAHIQKIDRVPAENIEQYVEDLCNRYNVLCGSVDRYPFTPTANNIHRISKGKIWPTHYSMAEEVKYVDKDTDSDTYMAGNRTLMCDKVSYMFKSRKIEISGYSYYQQLYIDQVRAMVREQTPDTQARWKALNDNDHFFHATGYFLFSYRILKHLGDILAPATLRSTVALLGVDTKPLKEGFIQPGAQFYPVIGR